MNIPRFTQTALAMAGLAAMATLSPAAHADAIIDSMLTVAPPNVNQIEDTDVDRILDSTGAAKTSGDFVVGDTIQSLLRFNTANVLSIDATLGPANPNYQLFALSNLTITGFIEQPGDPLGNNDGTCDAGEICLAITSGTVQVYEGTAVAQTWFGEAPATAISEVQAETNILNLSTAGANFFTFNFINDGHPITDLAGLSGANNQQGAYTCGLTATSNPGNIPYQPLGVLGADGLFHDFRCNGSAFQRSSADNAGWLLSTNTTVEFLRAVPEPGSLALLGLGLATVGWIRRRRG